MGSGSDDRGACETRPHLRSDLALMTSGQAQDSTDHERRKAYAPALRAERAGCNNYRCRLAVGCGYLRRLIRWGS